MTVSFGRLEVHTVTGQVHEFTYVNVEVRDGILHVIEEGAYDLSDALASYPLTSVIRWNKVA